MVLLVACGGADLVLPGEGEPAAIAVVKGDGQSGRVGGALTKPVVARVTDSQDRPVTAARVAFAFTGDAGGATVAPDTATTDGEGQAAFQIVLGTRVGGGTAEVRVPTAGGKRVLSAPLGFDAVSSAANQLLAVAGDGQSAPAGAPLPDPLVVQVTDAFGNPIPGVEITWAADAGSVSPSTSTTGADGLASADRTLGPAAGTQHATASAPGLAGSPATFTHTATPGSATVLERVSGDGQSALAGTSVAQPLVVRVRDAAGNPVAGLAVTWVVGDGEGTLTPQTSPTDLQGLASTRWTLGVTPGTNTATAVVSGGGTAGFSARGNPGVPPGLSLVTPPPDAAERGVGFSRRPVIQLREPDGAVRRRGGVAVSVSLVTGGGTLRGSLTRATGADGRVEFGDLAIEGPPGAYALAFTAAGYTGASSPAIQLARARTTTAILADDPDPSVAGAPVRVRFRVQSPGGTPTGTVRVSADDGTACTASVADGECILSPTAVGNRTLTAAYSGSTEFESSSASQAHVVQAPAPTATATTITADDPDPSEVRQAVTIRFSVTAGAGTLAGAVTVTSSGGESCSATVADGACTLTFTAPGDRTLAAVYAGGAGFAGSSDTEPHTVAVPTLPSLSLRKQPSSTATPGIPFKRHPELQLLDGDGKPLERSGVTVTAALASGSGSLTGTVVGTTDEKGKLKFEDLAISGPPGVYTIGFSADGFTPVTSDPIELRQASSSTSIQSDGPDPSAVGAPVEVQYRVTSEEGTPTGTVTVSSDGGETCSGAVADGGCSIVLLSPGARTLTASYGGDGTFAASAATTSHTVSAPNAPPVAVADAFAGIEDQALVVHPAGVLGNDTDPEGAPLQASVVSGPAHGALALASDGGFTYTPAPDFSGGDGFTYQASDGTLTSAPVEVQLAIAPVNDAPSFLAGPDQSLSAAAGSQTVPGWATAVSPGPADEASQTVAFAVQVVSGAELFTAAPAVAADGTLTYTPSGSAGTARLSVILQDSGGTADGGVDTSPPQTFTITFTESS